MASTTATTRQGPERVHGPHSYWRRWKCTAPARSTAPTRAAGSSRSRTARPCGCAATATTRSPRGALCAKVNGYLEHTRAPDRLLYPLRRVGAQGRGPLRADLVGRGAGRDRRASCTRVIDEYGGEAIWPFQGTGTLGYIQGLEGRAGQRLWNVLGASRHDMTACSVAGRHRRALHDRHRGGHGPGDVRRVQADPAVGHEHAHERPPPVEVHQRGARSAARTSSRSTRCARARPTQAHEHLAPLPGHRRRARARPAVRDRSTEGARGPRVPRAPHARLGRSSEQRILEFPPDRVARDHRACREERIVALGERHRAHPADRHPRHDGHAAPRRRRRRRCARSTRSRA